MTLLHILSLYIVLLQFFTAETGKPGIATGEEKLIQKGESIKRNKSLSLAALKEALTKGIVIVLFYFILYILMCFIPFSISAKSKKIAPLFGLHSRISKDKGKLLITLFRYFVYLFPLCVFIPFFSEKQEKYSTHWSSFRKSNK